MTSESEAQKTSEFLRRRKLRLQQVREQSKDIAKKIRLRAKVENLRQVVDLDEKKEKDYIHSQEKVVKKLEELYSRGLDNVGSSHKQALRVTQPVSDTFVTKPDLSQLRGREAAAELKRQKQQKFDELKKSLDRKIQAREAANVLSREKSATTANKLSTKSSTKSKVDEAIKSTVEDITKDHDLNNKDLPTEVARNDMGTQWDNDLLPPEWEPAVPTLAIPQEDSVKGSVGDSDNYPEKQKRPNLFALSDEMPSSLRGGAHQPCDTGPLKLSTTFVSEYIQNRALRLRESEVTDSNKKHSNELKNLRQTITRSRPLKLEGNPISDAILRSKGSDNYLTKKKSITMYNHSTRDTRDVPRAEEQLVHRDSHSERDAYSQALSETASACNHEKQKKNQDKMNKIAMTRQNVEKEYEDTMQFLNSLPKNKTIRPINNAFKDDNRLQAQRENRQRILQQEFRNIEKESRRLDSPGHKVQSRLPNRSHTKRSNSPPDLNVETNFNDRDVQYSWMPIPESDSNLAVHTIPTAVRSGRAGSSVKFSRVDSYHEYRSRHKHTPPTKDTGSFDKKTNKRIVETVIIEKDAKSLSGLSVSDNSSTEGPESDPNENKNANDNNAKNELTDAERIIIYKILSCKHKRNNKTGKNNSDDVLRDGEELKDTENEKTSKVSSAEAVGKPVEIKEDSSPFSVNTNPLNIDNLKEGVYEVADDTEDNLESMYYAELDKRESKNSVKCDKRKQGSCSRRTVAGSDIQQSRKKCTSLKCKSHSSASQPADKALPSAIKKPSSEVAAGPSPEVEFVKLVDDGGKQEGNFYIGATGFLKDNAYEVIIQLRKKDTLKEIPKQEIVSEKGTVDAGTGDTNNPQKLVAQSGLVAQVQQKESKEHIQPQAPNDKSEICTVVPGPQRSVVDPDSVIATDIPVANGIQDNDNRCPSSAISDDVPLLKMKHDKSVSTSFKDTYPLPEPLAKDDPVTATSTYTQTTLGSPNPRPVYIHMSSSTSTAYMSPPEVVLPNYLRRGHEPCRKLYRTHRKIEEHEERNLIHQERHCKKHTRCNFFKNIVTEPTFDRLESDTARSSEYTVYRMRASTLPKPVSHMTNSRCSKCKTRGDSRIYRKQNSHKSKHQLTSKPSIAKSVALHNKKSKTNTRYSKKSNKSYLSPVIKEYIHKLLSLNREGIKAIQVINQDCSSVNTPTSSIVNVPSNLSNKTSQFPNLDLDNNGFSLEQIKNILKQHVFLNNCNKFSHPDVIRAEKVIPGKINLRKRNSKKKILHKVKSLNISKKIVITPCDASTNTRVSNSTKQKLSSHVRSQGVPSADHFESQGELGARTNILTAHTNSTVLHKHKNLYVGVEQSAGQPKISISGNSSPNSNDVSTHANCIEQPINTSTQTSCTVDGEMNFIKLAEDKLQNMEKIADLTEKCTKRLSNLAKVLEEVRKNKSLAYSQISTPDSTSDSDRNSDNVVASEIANLKFPPTVGTVKDSKNEYNVDSTDESLLSGAPKPGNIEYAEIKHSENVSSYTSSTELTSTLAKPVAINDDCRAKNNTKSRNKPPPALLRINLRRPQENIVPHELSTVIEVDSPLSVKFKSQSSTTNTNQPMNNFTEPKKDENFSEECQLNPEIIPSIGIISSNDTAKVIATDSSDESKLQMMDLNQFNEIMLKPFISLKEYAQDYYKGNMNTKCDSISKDNGITDDISSLHSDGSLPDVVAELLKRKLITEPFRFDTASNVNSTTVSSESTLSVLALSKVRKDKNKSNLAANKENVGETSDSLSISSNPDLENAFKKLGMGWASSTLKKTKERLALSSSSNTSSSSLSHIKFKNTSKQDALVTDSISSVPNYSKKPVLKRQLDTSKNAEQQTSFTNSMTVKEFLTKELAKKITFTDNSDRNDSNQEFVSLFETKLPENLKKSSQTLLEDNSGGSAQSGNNNRARTSTPVNIFKSVTYHSSSSSNMSNGLFSNADDLSSVKLTSTSMHYQSTSEKDELTIPNCSLKMRKALSDCSKTDSC